jgi:NAD(P)H-dependent FMN reductase
MKNVLAIIGSASVQSSNRRLVENFIELTKEQANTSIIEDLRTLPHFQPELSIDNTPKEVLEFRQKIEQADAILICTPEYIFSIPSNVKNAMEWCVATTIFDQKPVGIITASAHGQKGHEELQLVMKTIGALFTDETTLLIQGIKGRMTIDGKITDEKTYQQLVAFTKAFIHALN